MADDDYNAAFNRGCDSRLAGQPMRSNPFDYDGPDRRLYEAFRDGWRDVESSFGSMIAGGRPLPAVRRKAKAAFLEATRPEESRP